MMDGSGAGFVSSGSCGVDISESSGCNYKVQVYYQRIRNLDAFALEAAKLRIESFDGCATTRGSRSTHVELYIRSNGS
jgi:hypothetical protein